MPSAWERVADDPVLLAALRRNYTGPGDALDRLWWLEHPGSPTPDGRPDPAAELEAARQAAYRPGAEPGAGERAQRAEEALASERESVRRALRAAEAERAATPASAPTPTPHVPRRLLAGVAIAALVLGGVTGLAIARFTGPPRPAALAVFDRAQRGEDRPPATASLPSGAVRSSLRLLGTSSTTGTSVYAARTRGDDVCLIASVLADAFVSTCTSEPSFALTGLSMTFRAAVDPDVGSAVARPVEISPHWTPGGTLTF